MRDPALIRGVAFFVPLLATLALAAGRRRKLTDPELAAVIVATAWNVSTIFALNQLAIRLGWWTFDAEGAIAAGVPVDLWLGWALLWGAVPALVPRLGAAGSTGIAGVVAVLGLLDLAFMPLAAPVVQLGENWLTGELVGILAALVPAQLLARWTLARRRLWLRVVAQAGLAIGLMFGLPIYLLEIDFLRLLPLAPVLAAPAALGLAAVWEFASRGRGTPLPYDPPRTLVTTGPYARTKPVGTHHEALGQTVRNPMQLSMTLIYLVLAAGLADVRMLAGAGFAFCYGAGLASWHEGGKLAEAYGDRWLAYQAKVRPWMPRRPRNKPVEAGPIRR
jgi:protein-S-isoprenylcysteine O-methyltransferase Ste14